MENRVFWFVKANLNFQLPGVEQLTEILIFSCVNLHKAADANRLKKN